MPLLIFQNNLIWYFYDMFANWGTAFEAMRPSMYDNWFTRLLMGNPIGIWYWYDVFTI
jgi:hypothetical protein